MPPVYDPRLNAAVTLHVNEKVPLGTRTEETPLKTFLVGPHTTGPVKRPVTAPVGRSQEIDPKPAFLAADGKWGVDLSLLAPIKSPKSPYASQSMWSPGNSPTGTMAHGATATWTRGSRAIRPVSSVYTYADRSPVAIGDHVAEVGSVYRQQLGSKPGSRQNSRPASTGHVRPGSRAAQQQQQQQQLNGTKRPAEAPATVDFKLTDAAVQVGEGEVTRRPSTAPLATAAAAAAWGLGAATAHISAASRAPSVSPYTTEQLMIEDLVRDGPNLGRVCVPGSPNARLVGGRWRFVSNPVDGDSVYTDYYGRYGPDRCNYYGRAYNIDTTQFAKNRLVGDTDYMRVQASMPGISTLRSRPGLVLRATVNNGATDKLADLPGANSYGVHKISDFYNIAESEANLYA